MPTERSMRFAVQLTTAASGPEWIALSTWAESSGFDVVSMPDHLGGQLAPLVALGAASSATSTLRFSTFVLAIGLRHLGILAKEVSTLDWLSNGRVEIGLGAGWAADEFAALGVSFPSAGDRLAQLGEAVPILRALWLGQEVSAEGRWFTIRNLQVTPAPVRSEGIPIVLGGGGHRMLSFAGREADIVSIAPLGAHGGSGPQLGWSSVTEQVAWIAEGAGERSAPPELNLRVLGVTASSDPAAAAQQLASQRAEDPDSLLDSPFMLLGRPEDMVEQLERLRSELGITYFTISQRHATTFADVIAHLR